MDESISKSCMVNQVGCHIGRVSNAMPHVLLKGYSETMHGNIIQFKDHLYLKSLENIYKKKNGGSAAILPVNVL